MPRYPGVAQRVFMVGVASGTSGVRSFPGFGCSTIADELRTCGAGMADISIRGLEEPELVALKEQAAKESVSVNALVVRLLGQAAEVRPHTATPRRYHDLDVLFGTRSTEAAAAFAANTAIFDTNDLWIAASALENGAALLTLDAHHTDIDGLRAGADSGRVSALRCLRDCSSDRS